MTNFSKILTNWYSVNKRNFPWRKTKNPYYIWLSEIILQQTQIKQGLPYYKAFVGKFPTVFDLANANEEVVLKLWQGLGYYSRARNLHHSAKYIAYELNGKFPNTYKELLKLKGVGDYTASAIASICYNEATAVVDGNVYRVLARYYGYETPINSSEGVKLFKALATKLMVSSNPGDYNQAIMEFGAIQCKPQNPDCEVCPLVSSCAAFQTNSISKLPVKLKKVKIKKRHFNFLVFLTADGMTLFEKRVGKGIWQNLYQFPLIESESRLTAKDLKTHDSFKAHLKSKNFKIALYNSTEIIHKLSHQHLYTSFWVIELETLNDEAISISKLKQLPTPILIQNFIDEFDFE